MIRFADAHRHSWCRRTSHRTVEHGVTARFVEERAARPGFRDACPERRASVMRGI
jgi:hypothetical protein